MSVVPGTEPVLQLLAVPQSAVPSAQNMVAPAGATFIHKLVGGPTWLGRDDKPSDACDATTPTVPLREPYVSGTMTGVLRLRLMPLTRLTCTLPPSVAVPLIASTSYWPVEVPATSMSRVPLPLWVKLPLMVR